MITFYTHADGVVYFTNDTYLADRFIAVDRPATPDDEAAYPDEFAAFTNAPPTPVEVSTFETPVDPTLTPPAV